MLCGSTNQHQLWSRKVYTKCFMKVSHSHWQVPTVWYEGRGFVCFNTRSSVFFHLKSENKS
jgi:hypothetical protein